MPGRGHIRGRASHVAAAFAVLTLSLAVPAQARAVDDAPEPPLLAAVAAGPAFVSLNVPYRSQLDGTPWAEANCGPASLSMALAALGINASPTELRREVLAAQDLQGNHVGSFVEALAAVAEARGARTLGWSHDDESLRRWSVDDVRRAVRQGRPVIVQVRYRVLPGRANAPYDGDHFIVVVGVDGADLLYHDPIALGGGPDLRLSGERLERAMAATQERYRFTALALERA